MHNDISLWTTITNALLIGGIHTLVEGTGRCLPLLAIAKLKNWSVARTLMWTFACSLSHIVVGVVVALAFIYLGNTLSANGIVSLDGLCTMTLTAYLSIVLGILYLFWGIRKQCHRHLHDHACGHTVRQIAPWTLIALYALSPCGIVLASFVTSATLGLFYLTITAIVFAIVTILPMVLLVYLGMRGINTIRSEWLDRYCDAIGGGVFLVCGLALLFAHHFMHQH